MTAGQKLVALTPLLIAATAGQRWLALASTRPMVGAVVSADVVTKLSADILTLLTAEIAR